MKRKPLTKTQLVSNAKKVFKKVPDLNKLFITANGRVYYESGKENAEAYALKFQIELKEFTRDALFPLKKTPTSKSSATKKKAASTKSTSSRKTTTRKKTSTTKKNTK